MIQTIHAFYENGVFHPTQSVDLPEGCEVQIDVRPVKDAPAIPSLDDLYEILGRRHCSGEHDLTQRHNEHHP